MSGDGIPRDTGLDPDLQNELDDAVGGGTTGITVAELCAVLIQRAGQLARHYVRCEECDDESEALWRLDVEVSGDRAFVKEWRCVYLCDEHRNAHPDARKPGEMRLDQITPIANLALACAQYEQMHIAIEAGDRARQLSVFANMIAEMSARLEAVEQRVGNRIVRP